MPTLLSKNKVGFSRKEIDKFNSTWPCSSLRSRSYWIEFDTGGDLLDTDIPEQDDGDAAAALAADAALWLLDQK